MRWLASVRARVKPFSGVKYGDMPDLASTLFEIVLLRQHVEYFKMSVLFAKCMYDKVKWSRLSGQFCSFLEVYGV